MMKRSFASAQLALRQFVGDQLKLQQFNQIDSFQPDSMVWHVSSSITGDLTGMGHLIVSPSMANDLFAKHLPPNLMDTSPMQEGLISELCNIAVSAIITEISDLFDLELYGQVPLIQDPKDADNRIYSHNYRALFASNENATIELVMALEEKFSEYL